MIVGALPKWIHKSSLRICSIWDLLLIMKPQAL
jgi:hypothetical protein